MPLLSSFFKSSYLVIAKKPSIGSVHMWRLVGLCFITVYCGEEWGWSAAANALVIAEIHSGWSPLCGCQGTYSRYPQRRHSHRQVGNYLFSFLPMYLSIGVCSFMHCICPLLVKKFLKSAGVCIRMLYVGCWAYTSVLRGMRREVVLIRSAISLNKLIGRKVQ